MKLTIERGALLKALGHVQGVVERRNTIPILSNAKLEAENGSLALTATDMDVDIVERVQAQILESGAATVPAHTLYEIVRKLPEGSQVEMEHSGNGRLALSSGRSRFALSSLPTDDFPIMASDDMTHSFSLPASELRAVIDRTRFAVSTEETRYYLNGIFLHAAQRDGVDVLRAVATDGHRLASVETSLPPGAADMPGVIVPRKAVGELHRLLEETGIDIESSLCETKIRFVFADVVLTSKLIDGAFPDYEQVIPTTNDKKWEVDRRLAAKVIDRVSAISSERSRAIKIEVKPGCLTLSAVSPENGTAVEEVEIDYQGEALEIGFNSRYLLDIVQQIEGDTVCFLMADAASPTIVCEESNASALYLLMPMRV